ncbi:MAG: radical SAM protein [Candidatus Desulfaltia sp.]|nr:radical SAM protein [Candidatus Desulfaltia sp.]
MAISAWKPFLVQYFTRWWELQLMPHLDWIQIDVTSRCNALCSYCPRTAYLSRWNNRDLSPDTFEALLPVFSATKMVHLQGWGEPLLHKRFFEMVASTKKAGCQVGTTTNGMLLDGSVINRLIKSGIDYVAFSMTGIDEKNDMARKGTEFSRIIQAISDLAVQKKVFQVEAPVINVAYLLLRSHLPDIGKIIPRLKGLGIQQVTVSTLDFVACKDLRKELLLPENEGEYRELKSLLDGLVRDGERAEILVNYHLVLPGKRNQICTENPRRSLFVSADGSISPCVFLNIPAPGSSRVAGEGECEYQRLTFGNLSSESLPAIWKSQCYKEFRNSFDSTPHPFCLKCPKLHEV